MSIDDLGINYVETDELGRVVALRGRFRKSGIKFFSEFSDKVYNWASLDLDYCGG